MLVYFPQLPKEWQIILDLMLIKKVIPLRYLINSLAALPNSKIDLFSVLLRTKILWWYTLKSNQDEKIINEKKQF
jgi:hypothetical protein